MTHRTITFATPVLGLLLLASSVGAQERPRGGAETPAVTTDGRNEELKRAFAGVGDKVSRHVVSIRTGSHRGYGVVLEDGLVLTSDQILSDGRGLQVQTREGQTFPARVLGRSSEHDLALLAVQAPGLKPLARGSSTDLVIGQFVVTVGNESTPLCVGVVSAKNRAVEASPEQQGNILMGLFSDGNEGHQRAYPRVLQHDGPLRPDQFGPPIVDGEGRLVGINVAAPYRGSSHAVGIDLIMTLLADLKAGGSGDVPMPNPGDTTKTPPAPMPSVPSDANRPWLGVSAEPAPKDALALDYTFGIHVNAVTGPAEDAGLQAGDVIVAVDGKPFPSIDAFAAGLATKKPGDTVQLTLLRGPLVLEQEVTLGQQQ